MTTQPYQAGADPDGVQTLEDLAGCLRTLRIHAGNRSYRELERWVTEQRAAGRQDLWLTRSSLSEALTGKRLPTKEFMLTFLQACEVPEEERRRWTDAWVRVATAVQMNRQTKAPSVVVAEQPPARDEVMPAAHISEPRPVTPGPAAPAIPPTGAPGPPVVRSVSRLMEWLSGADRTILAACPRDRTRFVSLGGTVLTTAALATMSVVFTAKIALGMSIGVAVALGLAWGLAIMNLDRWIVAASPRREHAMQNLAGVLPRLTLSLLLGVTISTPLVLWIFNREVEAELAVMQAQSRSAFATELRQDPRFSQIPALERRADEMTKVAFGAADGPDAKRRQAVAKIDLDRTNADLSRLRTLMNAEETRFSHTSANDSGILARIDALGRLTSMNSSLRSAYLGLVILLTVIDVLPVLVKLMMNNAPPTLYDRLVAHADRADADSIPARRARP